MHVFCIFVFAPVQHNWACFTWKGAIQIRSLLLLLLLLQAGWISHTYMLLAHDFCCCCCCCSCCCASCSSWSRCCRCNSIPYTMTLSACSLVASVHVLLACSCAGQSSGLFTGGAVIQCWSTAARTKRWDEHCPCFYFIANSLIVREGKGNACTCVCVSVCVCECVWVCAHACIHVLYLCGFEHVFTYYFCSHTVL